MWCISLNMNPLQLFFKFKIFIIKIPTDSIFIHLVLNAVCLSATVYHVKADQYDISAKTIPIWLHYTVDSNNQLGFSKPPIPYLLWNWTPLPFFL